jgi:imidazoleglycerol phosphate synthase glutamine amidotransferase subunit HisH
MTQKVMTNDEEVSGSKKIVLPISGTFGRYVTNLRGTFVENVKKRPKSTHPTVLYTAR